MSDARKQTLCALGLIIVFGLMSAGVAAQDLRLPPDTGDPFDADLVRVSAFSQLEQTESWAGGEASRNVWSLYSGLTWAPFGSIRDDGWRLRVTGGYGMYSYRSNAADSSSRVRADVSFADVQAGYHLGHGALTIKGLVGASFEGHGLAPQDAGNERSGRVLGYKLAVETWLELGAASFASLNLTWASANSTAAGRIRLGYRLLPSLALGLEAGGHTHSAGNGTRAGPFVRYSWDGGEVSVSGGMAGRVLGGDSGGNEPYGSLVYLSRF